jgi:hypothetical protein
MAQLLESTVTGDLTVTGGFFPRRLSQTTAPASGTGATQIQVGELVIWSDSDAGDIVYLVYNDPVEGIVSHQIV